MLDKLYIKEQRPMNNIERRDAGLPCKVIRKITEDDCKFYFKDREFDAI